MSGGHRICLDEDDRDRWVDILGRAAERFGWRVLAFGLLDNRFHLFLRTPGSGLAAAMGSRKVRRQVEELMGRARANH